MPPYAQFLLCQFRRSSTSGEEDEGIRRVSDESYFFNPTPTEKHVYSAIDLDSI